MKIEVEKLEANLHDKIEYVTDKRNLKQARLKPYIDMNTDLRKKSKA